MQDGTWDRRDYDLARHAARKAQLVEILGGKCVRCGTTENLEFDHLDRTTKKFSIMARWNRPISQLQEELSKCQLLCKKCHRARTSSQISVEHGGGRSGRRRCGCDPCRLKYNEYMRTLKARLRAERRQVS